MYESFYGLTGKPFQLNPDPSFFYASRGHKRAFAYLEYGLYQSEGFIVITGEVGAGKTTIVRGLLEQARCEQGGRRLISSARNSTPDDLLRSIGLAFGLSNEGDGQGPAARVARGVLLQVRDGRKARASRHRRGPEPDRACVEELRMLSNFQLGDKALVQSFWWASRSCAT
jgi:hypothetical protein